MSTKTVTLLCLVLVLVGAGFTQWQFGVAPERRNELRIEMLNVGQGDAIYIRTPQGQDILIDGSIDRHTIHELGAVMPPNDRTIELAVATHPDADHIAGLAELPQYYRILNLIRSGAENNTGFYRALNSWEEQGVTVLYPKRGEVITLEEDLELEILHPVAGVFHEGPNDDSVMFILRYHNFSTLFTGDAAQEIEEEIVELYAQQGRLEELNVDILKVGHHGSKTSTGAMLLEATTPTHALISVGVGNKFGHPHNGPLHRLEQSGATILRTDLHGRITCTSDGTNYECITAHDAVYAPGSST